MKLNRALGVVALWLISTGISQAQDFGLSFSYFVPRNGYFSTPISPFSSRGLGVDFNRFLAIETGASLYRMSGLNLKDLPFESQKPLVGPNFTLLVPAEFVLGFRGPQAEFEIKAGGFFFYGFAHKITYGNFDEAMRHHQGWMVADGDLAFENGPGFGYHGGAELVVYLTNQFGISLETNYFVGESKFPLTGIYWGGTSEIEQVSIDYADAKIDFTGLEFSVGLIFSSGRGQARPPKRRR